MEEDLKIELRLNSAPGPKKEIPKKLSPLESLKEQYKDKLVLLDDP
jgi:hypothetical protein